MPNLPREGGWSNYSASQSVTSSYSHSAGCLTVGLKHSISQNVPSNTRPLSRVRKPRTVL